MGLVVPSINVEVIAGTNTPIEVQQGATWLENFQWTYGATEEEAEPVDLNGASAFAVLRETLGSASALVVASTAEGTITLEGEVTGGIEIRVPRALAGFDLCDKQKIHRQLEIHWPDGDICRLVHGRIVVRREALTDSDEIVS